MNSTHESLTESETSGSLAFHNRFAPLSTAAAEDAFDDGFVSRFAADFDRIATLGKGGFGRVWRVRNKLDGVECACLLMSALLMSASLMSASLRASDCLYECL
jgi:hypothetical protein